MSNQSNIILLAHDVMLRYKSRSGLFKKFEHTALNGISFHLNRGETMGILGRNGCGKSSLLRILAGLIKPTSGKIVCDAQTSRALLTLGLGFRPDLTGRDNALLSALLQGVGKKQALNALPEILEFSELGVFFDQPVKTYSSGMRARLGFSTALMTEVDVLLIDETLSVGDAHFKQKAEKAMIDQISSQQTVVFVSHSVAQINKLCDRVMWLESGVVKAIGAAKEVSTQYSEFMKAVR